MKLNNGLHPNTVWKHKMLLNGVFSYALMQDLITKNPLDRVISPQRKESPVKYFNNDELKTILSKVRGTTIETPVNIAIYCGSRRGEVLGMKWRAVNFNAGTIAMEHTITMSGRAVIYKDGGKTKSSVRTIYMPEPLRLYLQNYRNRLHSCKDNDYLCIMKNAKTIKPDYLTKSFKEFLAATQL